VKEIMTDESREQKRSGPDASDDAFSVSEIAERRHEDDLARPRHSRNRNLVIVGIVALVAMLSIFLLHRLLSRKTPADVDDQPAKAASETAQTPTEVILPIEALNAAAIEIVGVTQRPAVARLTVTGSVAANQQQTQQVTPLVGGRVERVNVALGDRVSAGTVLATISSPQIAEMRGNLRAGETKLSLAERNLARVQRAENRVGVLQAKAKLDEAEATLRRTRRLIELGVGAGKDLVATEAAYKTAKAEYDFQSNIALNREVQQAQADFEMARTQVGQIRQSLTALGATPSIRGGNSSLLPVLAPVSGTVTERLINAGAGIEAGKPLFTIANLSTVWVIANVPEAQVSTLHLGAPAEVRSAGLGSIALAGSINYIDSQLDEQTRTARVRVEVPNSGERLKVGMFVEVSFQAGASPATGEELMVSSVAVQRMGDRTVVFIPKSEEGHFEVRDVQIGGEVEGYSRVIEGLKLGDRVVTKGSFQLKSQLMKGQFGEDEK